MKLYGIKNCDTVKKVITFLADNSVEHTFVDLKKETVEADKIVHWANALGVTVLINTKSATYRALDDTTKQNLSIDTIASVVASNQSIMKRPIIEYTNGDITVGFNDAIKEKING